MTIVLDAMGTDQHPIPEITAASKLANNSNFDISLVGHQDILEKSLSELGLGDLGLKIHHAKDIVSMQDKAVASAKTKPENSMAVGIELVKSGKAKAFVTAGNTGAAYFNAIRILKRIKGISRPALTTTIPTKNGRCVFMDTGANADCRPEFLFEFAIMGGVFAEKTFGIKNPRIALLSNGEEEGKGNTLVRDAYKLLKESSLNFLGNIEPKEIFAGKADVVIADGFTGNVFIKTSEAVAKFITDILKDGIRASFLRKLGYLLVKPAFAPLKSKLDPAEIGAAILLGVDGLVFIGHGSSDSRAMISAVKLAQKTIDTNLLDAIKDRLQEQLSEMN
ncbi:MAG: phosphate acyltransferase PlsX [Anaerolineaceae bacterium]|nr:phosphate acyltransferase PlsX [Anaerolineaceae bacterium]